MHTECCCHCQSRRPMKDNIPGHLQTYISIRSTIFLPMKQVHEPCTSLGWTKNVFSKFWKNSKIVFVIFNESLHTVFSIYKRSSYKKNGFIFYCCVTGDLFVYLQAEVCFVEGRWIHQNQLLGKSFQ